jgi:hypothetical protein
MLKLTYLKERPFRWTERFEVLSLLVDARKGRSVVLNPGSRSTDPAVNGSVPALGSPGRRSVVVELPVSDRIR